MTNPPNTHSHNAVGYQNEAQKVFVDYVATMEIIQSRLKEHVSGAHITQKEIEDRFFRWPTYDRKKQIQFLVDNGFIQHWHEKTNEGRKCDYYKALRFCGYRPGLVKFEKSELGETQKYMLECLLNTDLPENIDRPAYFDFFMQYRDDFPFLFFRIDDFAKRVHTPVTSLSKQTRENILLFGYDCASIDIKQSQPTILAAILEYNVGNNPFSEAIKAGHDVYEFIQDKLNLSSRDQAKDKFFKISYGYPSGELSGLFERGKWISWINQYKSRPEPRKPAKYSQKHHNNLSWLLQNKETKMMKEIWIKLAIHRIPFLTVHDEVLVNHRFLRETRNIFNEVLPNYLPYYQLNEVVKPLNP